MEGILRITGSVFCVAQKEVDPPEAGSAACRENSHLAGEQGEN